MDQQLHTPFEQRRRRGRPLLAVLLTTRPGRVLLLVLAGLAAFVASIQPAWAIDPLHDLAEEALSAFGAGLAPAALWAAAVLVLLNYRPRTLVRRWHLVLGSAALTTAALGALAFFRGSLPMLDTANLG